MAAYMRQFTQFMNKRHRGTAYEHRMQLAVGVSTLIAVVGVPLSFSRIHDYKTRNRVRQENTHKEDIHRLVWEDLEKRYATAGKTPKPMAIPDPALDAPCPRGGANSYVPSAATTPDGVPPGWRPVESRSRPGETSYENVFTAERIAWKPLRPASRTVGRSI